MKKFIIMSLALFALALTVGCKDKKETADDCEDDQVWNEEEEKCEAKPADDDGAEVVKYSINNMLEAAVTVSSGDASKELAKDACVNVTAEQWAALKVSDICDNSDEDAENNCPEAGNKDVKANADASANELAAAEAMKEGCEDLAAAAAETPAEEDTADDTADDTAAETPAETPAEDAPAPAPAPE